MGVDGYKQKLVIYRVSMLYTHTNAYRTYRETVLVFEWWSFKPADVVVLSSSHHSERPGRAIVDGIDRFTVPHDLPHRATRVPQEHMTIPE